MTRAERSRACANCIAVSLTVQALSVATLAVALGQQSAYLFQYARMLNMASNIYLMEAFAISRNPTID